MTHQRIFNFPVPLLIGQSTRLLGALRDATVGPGVLKRIKTDPGTTFDATLESQIKLVEKSGTDQKTAGGSMIQLTQEQATAYTEMEGLMAGARHSASLVFPKGDPRLHIEFSVGAQDLPHDLDHELQYANTIVKGCQTYADQLAAQGWTADDTTTLSTAVATLEGDPTVRDTAGDAKKRITSGRNSAANDLYRMCLTTQNAARLEYPVTKIGQPGIAEARARFLLDEFPPARGNGAEPTPPGPVPTPAVK